MKKLMIFISAAVIALLAMTVCVSAETYLDEDFSGEDFSVFYSLPTTTAPDMLREFVDGTLHIVNPSDATLSQALQCASGSLPNGVVLQFDVRVDIPVENTTGYIMMNFYCGGAGRTGVSLFSNRVKANNKFFNDMKHEQGTWYTYYIKTCDGKVDLFRKLRDSEELPILIEGGYDMESSHTSTPSRAEFYGAKGTDVYFDNIKCYEGTYVVDASLEMDGATVTVLDNIDGGILNARIDMVTSEVVTAEVDGVMCEAYGDATPIIVVYDKDRKMIYSEIYSGSGVHLGENTFEISVDTSSFADELKGGYLGFYLWDSFGSLQPVMDAIELR